MARRFNYRRVKLHRSYTVAELSALIGAHKHTIGRWIAAGLKTTDARRPFLIHGADFRTFMKSREPIKQFCQPASSIASAAASRSDQRWAWPTTTRARPCEAC